MWSTDNSKKSSEWYSKGAAFYAQKKHEEALIAYDKAINCNPQNEHAWSGKGYALYALKKYVEAVACFDRAMSLNPKLEYAWSGKGAALYAQGRLVEAAACYDRVIGLNPQFGHAWSGKGYVSYAHGRLAEAIAYFNTALNLNPKLEYAWSGKGSALYFQGKLTEALACYDTVISFNPKFERAWSGKGYTLSAQEKPGEAIACFDKAISLNPKFEFAWSGKSQVLFCQKNYAGAAQHYEQVLAINSSFPHAVQAKGIELFRQNKLTQAFELFTQAEQLAANKDKITLASLFNRRGQLLLSIEATDLARSAFNKVLSVTPECIIAQQGLEKIKVNALAHLPKPPLSNVYSKPALEQAYALYTYQAENTNELFVPENTVVDVLEKLDSGWWLCRYLGKAGLVPSTFLTQELPAAVNKPGLSSPKVAATKASELPSSPIALSASIASSTSASMTTASSIPLALTIPHNDLTYDDPTKPIGKGAFGEVYKGTWRHEPVAIKRLLAHQLTPAVEAEFKNEVSIMAQLRSDYIIALKGMVIDQQPFSLVISWAANGSLFDILHGVQDLPWSLRQQIAGDISKGLSFLHHEKILHRDLKSLNVLLDKHMQAKLTDFGLSKVKIETKSQSSNAESSKGTTRWKAPEIFGLKPQYSEKSDIYAYAMVVWELAARKIPYAEVDDDSEIRDAVKSGEREDIPTDCPPAIAQLIERCWNQKPEMRPTAHEVVEYLAKAPVIKEQAPGYTVSKAAKSWQVDSRIKPPSGTYTVSSQFLKSTEEDKQKVISYYQQYPVPGCDIGRIQVIYSPGVDDEFELRLRKLQKRAGKQAFEPKWVDESSTPEEQAWRAKIYGQFKMVTEPYTDSDYPNVKLIPAWHGTKKAIVPSILETGYANLATTDPGFFGKGLYSACEAEYSYRVYSSRGYSSEEGILLLNWVSAYSAYPVIDSDMSKLKGKGNYGNHDMHIVPVAPKNPNNPFEVNYFPCKPHQPAQYTEIVVFDSAHCLPRYLVELQPTLPKPMPTPAEYLKIQQARHTTFFKPEGISFKDKSKGAVSGMAKP